MTWQIEFVAGALKDLSGLDRPVAKRFVSFLRERLAVLDDPRSIGEALKGSKLGEFWKDRVGDYRIISRIEDAKVLTLAVKIGKRREMYKGSDAPNVGRSLKD